MKIIYLCVLLICFVLQTPLWAQKKDSLMRANLQKYAPKKIVSSISIIVGYALLLPYETTGYAENFKQFFQPEGIDASFQIKNKFGTVAGLAVFHSFGKRWELGARLLYERKGYVTIEEINRPGNYLKYQYEFSDKYLTFSFVPSLAIGKEKKFNISAGFLYNYFLQSRTDFSQFVNGIQTHSNLGFNTRSGSGKVKFNGSVVIGAGYAVSLNDKDKLCFQLQYNHGIGEIYAYPGEVKSNGIVLSVEFKRKNKHINK